MALRHCLLWRYCAPASPRYSTAQLLALVERHVPAVYTPLNKIASALPEEVMEELPKGLKAFCLEHPETFAMVRIDQVHKIRSLEKKGVGERGAALSGVRVVAKPEKLQVPHPPFGSNRPVNPGPPIEGLPPFLMPLKTFVLLATEEAPGQQGEKGNTSSEQAVQPLERKEALDRVLRQLRAQEHVLEFIDGSTAKPVGSKEVLQCAQQWAFGRTPEIEGAVGQGSIVLDDVFMAVLPQHQHRCQSFGKLAPFRAEERHAYLLAAFMSSLDWTEVESLQGSLSSFLVSQGVPTAIGGYAVRQIVLSFPSKFALSPDGTQVRYNMPSEYIPELSKLPYDELQSRILYTKEKKKIQLSTQSKKKKRSYIGWTDIRRCRRALAAQQGFTCVDPNVLAHYIHTQLPSEGSVPCSQIFHNEDVPSFVLECVPVDMVKFFRKFPELFFMYHQPPEWAVQRADAPRPIQPTAETLTDADVLSSVLCVLPHAIDPSRPLRHGLIAQSIHIAVKEYIERISWSVFFRRHPEYFEVVPPPQSKAGNETFFVLKGEYGEELHRNWAEREKERNPQKL